MANETHYEEIYRVDGRLQEQLPTWPDEFDIQVAAIKVITQKGKIVSKDEVVRSVAWVPLSEKAWEKALALRKVQK